MPVTHIREVTLFKFSELSASAKETAKQWLLSCDDGDDYTYCVDDFARMAEMMGVDVATRSTKLYGGGTGSEYQVRWGLHSQGSGAAFTGSYAYKKGAVAAIKKETNNSEPELIRIATELQELQRRHFYKLEAHMSDGTGSNFYPHSGTMAVEVTNGGSAYGEVSEDAQDKVKTLMRSLADWLYKRIDAEYDYRTSDEQVTETMEANEYTFDEEGRRED